MSESILIDIRRGVAETIDRAIRAWKTEQLNARLALRVEELVSVRLRCPAEHEELLRLTWKNAAANLIEDFQEVGQLVLEMFDLDLGSLASVQELVRLVEDKGYSVEGSTELQGTIEEVRRMKQQFVEQWPWINEQVIQEARAEYARGEYQSIREIMDGLPGSNP